jgi:NDP-mannose synthase
MRAVIMAGGLGTRLRPFTNALPKPLVPIGDRPVLDLILHQLKGAGFSHVTLAVGHLAELIQAYFGDGRKWGLKLDYTFEDKPLGTIGPLATLTDLPEQFLVMNADLLTNLPFAQLMAQHQANKALVTLATRTLTTQIEYGVLSLDDSGGQVLQFTEKPTLRHTASLGIHVLSRQVLGQIPSGQLFGLDHLMHGLLNAGQPINVFPFEGYWLDIGRPGDYEQAVAEFEQWKDHLLPEPLPTKPLQVISGAIPLGLQQDIKAKAPVKARRSSKATSR